MAESVDTPPMPNASSSEQPPATSDAALLREVMLRADDSAFEELVRRHGPMVLGVCRRVLGNQDEAEDAFQATFFVLALRLRAGRAPALPANWLFGVARRTAMKARVAKRRRFARLIAGG